MNPSSICKHFWSISTTYYSIICGNNLKRKPKNSQSVNLALLQFLFFAELLLRKLSSGHKIQLCLLGKDNKQFFLPSYWPNLLLFFHTTEVVTTTQNLSPTHVQTRLRRESEIESEREIKRLRKKVCVCVCVWVREREKGRKTVKYTLRDRLRPLRELGWVWWLAAKERKRKFLCPKKCQLQKFDGAQCWYQCFSTSDPPKRNSSTRTFYIPKIFTSTV